MKSTEPRESFRGGIASVSVVLIDGSWIDGPCLLDNHQVTARLAFLLVHEEPILGSVPVS
jgi:hypothetical protein